MKKDTLIISAFPGCGKTTCFNTTNLKILDSDSSNFSWIKDEDGNNTDQRNPNFPNNYMIHICENMGLVDVIFVSSHKVVRDSLQKMGIKFFLIYPDITLKKEWLQRYKNRGSSESFISLMDNNWDNFIKEMQNESTPPVHIELKRVYDEELDDFEIDQALIIDDKLISQIIKAYTETNGTDEVLDFIELIKGEPVSPEMLECNDHRCEFTKDDCSYHIIEEIFLNGDCGRFAMILQYVFPQGTMFYLPSDEHVYFEIDGSYYDVTGRLSNNYVKAQEYLYDSNLEKMTGSDIYDHDLYNNYSFGIRGPII